MQHKSIFLSKILTLFIHIHISLKNKLIKNIMTLLFLYFSIKIIPSNNKINMSNKRHRENKKRILKKHNTYRFM